jgi:hypothetical protein
MAPIQVRIVKELKKADLSVNELVEKVAKPSHASQQEVRSAVLPMISSNRVELTPDLKLHLPQ